MNGEHGETHAVAAQLNDEDRLRFARARCVLDAANVVLNRLAHQNGLRPGDDPVELARDVARLAKRVDDEVTEAIKIMRAEQGL